MIYPKKFARSVNYHSHGGRNGKKIGKKFFIAVKDAGGKKARWINNIL